MPLTSYGAQCVREREKLEEEGKDFREVELQSSWHCGALHGNGSYAAAPASCGVCVQWSVRGLYVLPVSTPYPTPHAPRPVLHHALARFLFRPISAIPMHVVTPFPPPGRYPYPPT